MLPGTLVSLSEMTENKRKARILALVLSWVSVGAALIVALGIIWLARTLSIAFLSDLHTGAKGPDPLTEFLRFRRWAVYLVTTPVICSVGLLFASLDRHASRSTTLAWTIGAGVWLGLTATLLLYPWGFYLWMTAMVLWILWRADFASTTGSFIGASLLVGMVALSFGLERFGYYASWQEDARQRHADDLAAVETAAWNATTGHVKELVERDDSAEVQRSLIGPLSERLRRTDKSDWTKEELEDLSDLADRGLRSDDEVVRVHAARLKAATLFLETTPGQFASTLAKCPDVSCRDRLAALLLDERNPHAAAHGWRASDVSTATATFRSFSRPSRSQQKSAARLLSAAARPGEVCDAFEACDADRCDGSALLLGFIKRLETEPPVSWTNEDVTCVREVIHQPHWRLRYWKNKAEVLARWVDLGGRLPEAD